MVFIELMGIFLVSLTMVQLNFPKWKHLEKAALSILVCYIPKLLLQDVSFLE